MTVLYIRACIYNIYMPYTPSIILILTLSHFSHINEHLDGVAKVNASDMSQEELEFHYFKSVTTLILSFIAIVTNSCFIMMSVVPISFSCAVQMN